MDKAGASVTDFAAIQRNLNTLTPTIDQQTEATKRAAAATGVQTEGLDKLLNKLSPARAATANYNKDLETLSKAYKAGEIDIDKYTAAVGTINGKLKALNGEGTVFDKLN